jgi:hypothetical protein
MKNAKKKVVIELSSQAIENIERLMRENNISSEKVFFNCALTVFEWILSENKTGRTIASFDRKKKVFKEIALPDFN